MYTLKTRNTSTKLQYIDMRNIIFCFLKYTFLNKSVMRNKFHEIKRYRDYRETIIKLKGKMSFKKTLST